MHAETLTKNTKKIWNKIKKFEKIKDFYLAGGTALALQIGHRISVDLDFFSDEPIKKTLLQDIEDFFEKPVEVLIKSKNELTIMIDEVKVTFLHYSFPLIYPLKYTVVSKDLITLKLIVENAKNKYEEVFNDRVFLEQLVYIDDIEDEPIQWIDKSVSIEEILDFFEKKIKEYLL